MPSKQREKQKILEVEQGSPEWFEARRGIPTSSNFYKIVTTSGEKSKQDEKYLYELAAERITGMVEQSYSNAHMERGSELENEARMFYELTHEVKVKTTGLWISGGCGASPDGLVGGLGLLEIKCPAAWTHISYCLDSEKLIKQYWQQVQGQLFVTGRTWCDLMSYYPGLTPAIRRIERDRKFQQKLRCLLKEFNVKLNELVKKLETK